MVPISRTLLETINDLPPEQKLAKAFLKRLVEKCDNRTVLDTLNVIHDAAETGKAVRLPKKIGILLADSANETLPYTSEEKMLRRDAFLKIAIGSIGSAFAIGHIMLRNKRENNESYKSKAPGSDSVMQTGDPSLTAGEPGSASWTSVGEFTAGIGGVIYASRQMDHLREVEVNRKLPPLPDLVKAVSPVIQKLMEDYIERRAAKIPSRLFS
jgi:hypothetical protein